MTPCLLALAMAAIALPSLAHAHAVLARSVPTVGATFSRPPERVDLWFSERLEPAFSGLSVWSASGAQVDRGDGAVGRDDPTRLSVTLAPLVPGTYTVRFRVLSVDGHVSEGSFRFAVNTSP